MSSPVQRLNVNAPRPSVNVVDGGDKIAFVVTNDHPDASKVLVAIKELRTQKREYKKQLEGAKEKIMREYDLVEQFFRHVEEILLLAINAKLEPKAKLKRIAKDMDVLCVIGDVRKIEVSGQDISSADVKGVMSDVKLRKDIEAAFSRFSMKASLPNNTDLNAVAILSDCVAKAFDEKKREKDRKRVLREWDFKARSYGGWSLEQIWDTFEGSTLKVKCSASVDDARGKPSGSFEFKNTSGDVVVTVLTGDAKYEKAIDPSADSKSEPLRFHAARGNISNVDNPEDGETRRKQYVADSRGIKTHRYMSRAINYHQLATMFGFKFDGAKWNQLMNDGVELANITDQDIMKLWQEQEGLKGGHGPRAQQHTVESTRSHFGPDSAVVDPTMWRDTHEVPDDSGPTKLQSPADEGDQFPSGPSGTRMRHRQDAKPEERELTDEEKAWAQIRDGSGDRQQLLSATAALLGTDGVTLKSVIRGNKGERFDLGPETVAAIEIDMAVLCREEIKVLNQHAEESQKYKIAYDRLKDQHIDKLKTGEVTEQHIKRFALEELSELIYSARKNREVVMERIPNAAITRVQLSGKKKWGTGEDFKPPIPTGQWVKWQNAEKPLEDFVRNLDNLVKLHRRAVPKMKLRGSRT